MGDGDGPGARGGSMGEGGDGVGARGGGVGDEGGTGAGGQGGRGSCDPVAFNSFQRLRNRLGF